MISSSDFRSATKNGKNEEQDDYSVDAVQSGSEVVLEEDPHEEKPSFGNIQLKNSIDIYFGNKTYYEGPVTVKQVFYSTPEDEDGESKSKKNMPDVCNLTKDSPDFVPDTSVGKVTENNIKIFVQPRDASGVEGTSWIQKFSRQHVLIFSSLSAVLLVTLVTLVVVLLVRSNKSQDSGEQDGSTLLSDSNNTSPNAFYIMSRQEWVANPPKEKPTPLELPVPYVIIMHTATEFCTDVTSCIFHVRAIQSFHAESRGWDDIGYNFLVGGDGNAYEGRGWYAVGAQVYGYNNRCIGIAFIGTFINTLPPERQIVAAKKLIEIGLSKGVISPDYKLLAARQLQTTQSPGQVLYENIKTWDHWSPNP